MSSRGIKPIRSSTAVTAADTFDEESLQQMNTSSLSLAPQKGGISISYRFSLSLDVKSETGGMEEKVLLDDACGTVAPGQVKQLAHSGFARLSSSRIKERLGSPITYLLHRLGGSKALFIPTFISPR